MGFDVYMSWKGQTKEENDAQFVGGSVAFGHVGYLRGWPTYLLNSDDGIHDGAPIRASVLRNRLNKALKEVERIHADDTEMCETLKRSYENFVALAERKEAETGEPVMIEMM